MKLISDYMCSYKDIPLNSRLNKLDISILPHWQNSKVRQLQDEVQEAEQARIGNHQ